MPFFLPGPMLFSASPMAPQGAGSPIEVAIYARAVGSQGRNPIGRLLPWEMPEVTDEILPPQRIGTMMIRDGSSSTLIVYEIATPPQWGGSYTADLSYVSADGKIHGWSHGGHGASFVSFPLKGRLEAEIKRNADGSASEIAYRVAIDGRETYFHAKRFDDSEDIQGYVVTAVNHGFKLLQFRRFDLASRERVYLSPIEALIGNRDLKVSGITALILDLKGDRGTDKHLFEPLARLVAQGPQSWIQPLEPFAYTLAIHGVYSGQSFNRTIAQPPPSQSYIRDDYFQSILDPPQPGGGYGGSYKLYDTENGAPDRIDGAPPFEGPVPDAVGQFYRVGALEGRDAAEFANSRIDVPLTDLRTMIGWIIARRMILPIR